jgi:hypothetical protein
VHAKKVQFWDGEADVAILCLKGIIRVYVAPDPLLLALELEKNNDFHVDASGSTKDRLPCFILEQKVIGNLVAKGLLHRDLIEANQAYHFNTARPHAVVADDEIAKALVVTTREDRGLPQCWASQSRPHGQ